MAISRRTERALKCLTEAIVLDLFRVGSGAANVTCHGIAAVLNEVALSFSMSSDKSMMVEGESKDV